MSALLRCVRPASRTISARAAFSTNAVARKDFVQELYLRELKSFKPTPQAKDAHVGQVKEFHSPASPAKPESLSSADLAKELDAYDASSPADVSAATSAEPVEEVEHRETADDFLESLRAPPAKEEAHH